MVVTPETVALTWKLVVAVAGAFTLNVNAEPMPTVLNPVNPVPTFVAGVKSDVSPFVAIEAPKTPVIVVIMQLIASPTRITVDAPAHVNTDVDDGLP